MGYSTFERCKIVNINLASIYCSEEFIAYVHHYKFTIYEIFEILSILSCQLKSFTYILSLITIAILQIVLGNIIPVVY